MSIIGAREKTLEHVPFMHYPIWFNKDMNKTQMQVLINLESEINAIYLFFAKQLGLPIRRTDIRA